MPAIEKPLSIQTADILLRRIEDLLIAANAQRLVFGLMSNGREQHYTLTHPDNARMVTFGGDRHNDDFLVYYGTICDFAGDTHSPLRWHQQQTYSCFDSQLAAYFIIRFLTQCDNGPDNGQCCSCERPVLVDQELCVFCERTNEEARYDEEAEFLQEVADGYRTSW